MNMKFKELTKGLSPFFNGFDINEIPESTVRLNIYDSDSRLLESKLCVNLQKSLLEYKKKKESYQFTIQLDYQGSYFNSKQGSAW